MRLPAALLLQEGRARPGALTLQAAPGPQLGRRRRHCRWLERKNVGSDAELLCTEGGASLEAARGVLVGQEQEPSGSAATGRWASALAQVRPRSPDGKCSAPGVWEADAGAGARCLPTLLTGGSPAADRCKCFLGGSAPLEVWRVPFCTLCASNSTEFCPRPSAVFCLGPLCRRYFHTP